MMGGDGIYDKAISVNFCYVTAGDKQDVRGACYVEYGLMLG